MKWQLKTWESWASGASWGVILTWGAVAWFPGTDAMAWVWATIGALGSLAAVSMTIRSLKVATNRGASS